MTARLTPREREDRILAEQLDALEEDIEKARKLARHIEPGSGTALDFYHEVPHPAHGEEVELPDGGRILVRQIEPADAHELELGFERLGALSRYRRFRARVDHPGPKLLAALADVDHDSAEVLVAMDPATGTAIGLAHYLRDPDEPEQAEVDCTVVDGWQQRGIGTTLAELLAERALRAGISRLTAQILVGDEPARRLVHHVSDAVSEKRKGGVLTLSGEIRLPTARVKS